MKNRNTTLTLILSLLVAGGAAGQLSLPASPDEAAPLLIDNNESMGGGLLNPSGDMMNPGPLVNADSLRHAEMLAAVDRATTLYKHLKWQKMEGEAENALYPTAMNCYEAALKGYGLAKSDPEEQDRCRNILRDINRDLLEGAFFYSGAGDNDRMNSFARAVVDTRLMDTFKGQTFPGNQSAYPAIVYCAASSAYNAKEYSQAIKYFDEYLATGEERSREQIYIFLGQACMNTGDYNKSIAAMTEAIEKYPSNYNFLLIAMQSCMDGGRAEMLQAFLDKAMFFRPGDEQLLMIQAKLQEDRREYQQALQTYSILDELKPNNLNIAKRMALCYYNLGVNYYNKVIFETDEKEQKKFRRQCDSYFEAATMKIEEVLANDPLNMKFLKALAVSYGCVGNMEKFEAANTRIKALGQTPVGEKDLPSEVTYNESNKPNFVAQDTKNKAIGGEVPIYSDFAKSYVEKRLAKWVGKGEFEKDDIYSSRVNDMTIRHEYDRLVKDAEKEYLTLYTRQLRPSDFKLKPYDTGSESYLIESNFGPIFLPVPLANGEAEIFKANWETMKIHNPSYYINDDQVYIAGITFVTSYGKSYTFDNSKNKEYAQTRINIDFDKILADANSNVVKTPATSAGAGKSDEIVITAQSDVDRNIPSTGKKSESTFAVIIANEKYSTAADVESALNDGEAFSRYCNLTLGLPKENIRIYRNATSGQMKRAMADIRNISQAMDGKADVIFYYAGHGLPDDATKSALLLPTDGDALVPETCIPLDGMYADLSSMGARSVMVFMDACFSGGQRDGQMLNKTRSVVIKHKDAAPRGNMFSLTAASAQETALPYREKNHGLFTYYLLKKLQETKGNVTLKELSEYVTENVKRQSTIINAKPQTPQANTSGEMTGIWHKKKLVD